MGNNKFKLWLILLGTMILLSACVPQNKEEVVDPEVYQSLNIASSEIWIAIGGGFLY